jgi:sec-independent protein translocase protein TatA
MGLGLDNPLHIAFIVVVVLLVFGAKRVPEIARSLGEGIRGFKDSVSRTPDRSQVADSKSPQDSAAADGAAKPPDSVGSVRGP